MFYIFGLSFEYHRYRRDAVLKVYADDNLVDEINLSESIGLKSVNLNSCPQAYQGPNNYSHVRIMPEKLLLFEIKDQHLYSDIRIEVQNDNNNYTNGFMTKSSYIKFHRMFLVPSCLLKDSDWMKKLRRFNSPVDCTDHSLFFDMPNYNEEHNEIVTKFDSKSKDMPWRVSSIGGNFSMKIRLGRKHHLVHLGRPKPGRMFTLWPIIWELWAFDQLNMSA